jgi:hypothetical protein
MLTTKAASAMLALRRSIIPNAVFQHRTVILQQSILRLEKIQPAASISQVRTGRLPNTFILARNASTSTSSSSAFTHRDEEDPDRGPRQPPRWFQRPIVLLLAFMPVFTFTLGVWQIQRLQWKLALIDELERKLKKEPLSLPKNIE